MFLFIIKLRMDDPTLYIILGVIGLLLGVSEGLGWSNYEANGVLDLIRILFTKNHQL
jgi:hypothetical protein